MIPNRSSIRPTNICIAGLWHQASVLAGCWSELGHNVRLVGVDPEAVSRLSRGKAPVREPKLDAMLRRNIKAGRLSVTSDYRFALEGAEFVFLSIDTPVTENDDPDLRTLNGVIEDIADCRSGHIVLCVTSQVPVGTSEAFKRVVEERKPHLRCDVVYIPEFLRLGEAVATFFHADRFVIGCDAPEVHARVAALYEPMHRPILPVSLLAAEMAKHCSNAFLAMSISFINEVSDICEQVGADVLQVAAAMKLDRRIGPHAFLSPGMGFAGGTLGRDIRALQQLGQTSGIPTRVMDSVMAVNRSRNSMVSRRLQRIFGDIRGLQACIWGLTYKPGTSTMRRSAALEVISELVALGAHVTAFDPLADLDKVQLPAMKIAVDPYAAAAGSDIIVLMTEWAGIRDLDMERILAGMRRPVFIDTRKCLDAEQMSSLGFEYFSIGRPAHPRARVLAAKEPW